MKDTERNVYLRTVPIGEAVASAREALDREALVAEEVIPAQEAPGRVASRPIHARYSSPTYHSAAMDGIAVTASQTFAAREGAPVRLAPEQYVRVNTGNPLPEGVDAVIMIEQVVFEGEDALIEAPAFPWQHVRRIGEDIVATELLFPHNHQFSVYDVGSLLGGGIWDVSVWERIRMTIIPTGDEVLDFTTRPEPGPGQVVESNSQVLSALARAMGCEPTRVPPVPDRPEAIEQAISDALDGPAHIVIVCAGSSAGSKDYTRKTFEKLGRVLVHGIAAMPGKPSLLGEARGKLLVGAPGYPVSSVVCFEELVAPLAAWLGRAEAPRRYAAPVRLTRNAPSKLGREEFLRLSIGQVGEELVATPLGRGAGNISTLSRAQGVTRIPAQAEGVEEGVVDAELFVTRRALASVLVAVGSHDNTLDVLADRLMGLDEPVRLTSGHVGSMGGLMAVKNGVTHLAGAHLFDPASGDYNFPFIEKYLPGIEVLVVNLAIRHQGLIVQRGNPRGIAGVEDLAAGELRFVNRQRGAGTRILFDYHLSKAGIAPDAVNGYGKEEFTHMAVAANVLTGAADTGLGIFAAAKALDLDFVPLAHERYDLVIPASLVNDPKIQAVLGLIRTEPFKEAVRALGGYETDLTGREMAPGMGLG